MGPIGFPPRWGVAFLVFACIGALACVGGAVFGIVYAVTHLRCVP